MRDEPHPVMTVTLEGPVDAELDELLRSLRGQLVEHGVDAGFQGERPPDGAKGVEIISGVVVPMAAGALPVLADAILGWVHRRRDRCSVTLHGPGGEEIHVPSVARDELQGVLSRWQAVVAPPPDGAPPARTAAD